MQWWFQFSQGRLLWTSFAFTPEDYEEIGSIVRTQLGDPIKVDQSVAFALETGHRPNESRTWRFEGFSIRVERYHNGTAEGEFIFIDNESIDLLDLGTDPVVERHVEG